jgi:regulator of sirC expression with transglutaminase-like and TPR domain
MSNSFLTASRWLGLILLFGCAAATPRPDARKPKDKEKSAAGTNSVEQLTAAVRDSIVVITYRGRDGREEGVGAGFVISADGLIATSLHVIGEGRPIRVQFANGRRAEVTEVHASDRRFDLAILRADTGRLPPLKLGDSDSLKQGAPVIAIGNPLGLERSVVQGVVSARREVEGIGMIQLAIPIEPGNSGGPLLDMKGRVQGILTLKSALTPNLGFAMPVNLLQSLVDRPNPVPMDRWLTLGALDPQEWTPLWGARWSQKAGRIAVEGAGESFGGRSLCLSQQPVPDRPFELAVSVKLEDESGAAGLVFGSDGADRHYGFYPSVGQLRLTRFDGPNVFSWHILKETATPAYKRGEWNHLRVRIEEERIQCFVNGEFVCDVKPEEFAGMKAGLAKFRDTRAEFRNFVIGTNLADTIQRVAPLPEELAARLEKLPAGGDAELVEALRAQPQASRVWLAERARQFDRDATRLRELGAQVHRRSVQAELVKALEGPEGQIDLFHAALLVAKYDNAELDPEPYRAQMKHLARELAARLPKENDGAARLEALRNFLFTEQGFHGSRSDYYNRANSYVNQVLDDREGLPITLSVLFLELAREIGLEKIDGLPLPGHFMVRYSPGDGPEQILDVFNGGKAVSRSEAQELVMSATGEGFREEHLRPATKRDIIARILRNLQGIAERSGSAADVLRYLDMIVALVPDSATDRLLRARLRIQTRDVPGAKEDLKWILDRQPDGVNLERIAELYQSL